MVAITHASTISRQTRGEEAFSLSFFLIKWAPPILLGLLLATNHYVRDAVGALEKQLESDPHLHFTQHDYSALNALYFFPNVITPLLAGVFIEQLGGISRSFLFSLIISSVGHVIFAMGIEFSSKAWMFVGKALCGTMYEIIDALMPIIYLGQLYQDDFQIVVGFMQIFIRLGSVVNFVITPWLYKVSGIKLAMWVASGVGVAGLPLFLLADVIVRRWYTTHPRFVAPVSKLETEEKVAAEAAGRDVEVGKRGGEVVLSPFVVEGDDDEEDIDNQGSAINRDGSSGGSSGSYARSNGGSSEVIGASQSHPRSETQSPALLQRMYAYFLELTQVDKFSMQFYCYFFSGFMLYGSIVPFWFFGSKYMQDNLYLPVQAADGFLTIPELSMVIIGFPLGLLVTKLKLDLSTKLWVLSISLSLMFVAFLLLFFAAYWSLQGDEQNPSCVSLALFSVILLGFGFAVSASLYWGSINGIADLKYLNQASGLVSCGINILPSILPPILVSMPVAHGHQIILTLAFLALFASLLAFAASNEMVLDWLRMAFFDGKGKNGSHVLVDARDEVSVHGAATTTSAAKFEYEMVGMSEDSQHPTSS